MKKVSPCSNCPFRTDSNFATAGLARAPKIARALSKDQGDFQCHKTTHETGNGKPRGCTGAYMVILNEGRATQMMRISARLGLISEAALEQCEVPVYDSLAHWVKAMLAPFRRRKKKKRRQIRRG